MPTVANGNNINLPTLLALLGTTSAAGAFPTPSSSNSNTIGSSNVAQTGNTTTSQTNNDFLNNLLQSLSSSEASTSQTGYSTPTLSPATQAFMDSLIGSFSSLTQRNTEGNAKNILANQIAGINKNSDAQKTQANEILAARGLANSPVSAVAEINNENSRFGQVNNARNNLPLLQQQLELQSLTPAASFFSSIPTGQVNGASSNISNAGVNTSTQNQNSGGVQNGTVNSNNASTTNTIQGTDTTGSVGGGAGGALSGLAGILATLFGGGTLPSGTSVTNTGATVTPGTTPGTTPPFVTGANGNTIPTTLPPGSGNSQGGLLGVLGTILGAIGLGGIGIGQGGGR